MATLLSFASLAQTMSPMGEGLPFAPIKLAPFKAGLVAVYIDAQQKLQLETWNGTFWNKLTSPELPDMGNNEYGLLEFKDIVEFKDKLYLIAEHTIDANSDAPNYILQWDGKNWTDISDDAILDAVSLDYLVVKNDQLICIGIFSGPSKNFNIARFTGSSWSLEGNLLTRNSSDEFQDLVVNNDKVYVTGTFSDPALGVLSMAEWDGNSWQKTNYPPFLGKNEILGNYKNTVVVYGQSSFSNEKVKVKAGTSWEDISSGLDNFTLNHVQEFQENGDALYMLGNFTEVGTSVSYNVLEYKNGKWQAGSLSEEPISALAAVQGDVIFAGNFVDGVKLNHVGRVIPYAQIRTGVYNDKNANCIKDADEDWLPNFPVEFGNNLSLSTDYSAFVYMPVTPKTYTVNAAAALYYEPTCPDVELVISDTKVYSENNFGVRKKSGIRDASIFVTDNQSFNHNVGQEKRVMICAANLGSEPIDNATLKFIHDDDIVGFSSEKAYDSYLDNEARWTISLQSEEKTCFYISFTAISRADLILDAEIVLSGAETDADQSNNKSRISYKNGSTLTNQKYCYNGEVIEENSDQIHYKIGFKNITDNNVTTVRLIDEFDHKINGGVLSSLGMSYTSSHPEKVSIVNHTYRDPETNEIVYKIEWVFKDINLPPSYMDDDGSEGFVDVIVNIKPNKFKVGEQICNTALIILIPDAEYAPEPIPITTNTVCSSIGDKVGAGPVIPKPTGLTIGPVPAYENLEVNNSSNQDYQMVVCNTLGQEVMNLNIDARSSNTINIEALEPGVYFIYTEGQLVSKLLVH